MENWFGNLLFNNTAVWEGGGIISNMSCSLLPAIDKTVETIAVMKFLNNTSATRAEAISMIQSQFDVENAHLSSVLRNSAKSDGGVHFNSTPLT